MNTEFVLTVVVTELCNMLCAGGCIAVDHSENVVTRVCGLFNECYKCSIGFKPEIMVCFIDIRLTTTQAGNIVIVAEFKFRAGFLIGNNLVNNSLFVFFLGVMLLYLYLLPCGMDAGFEDKPARTIVSRETVRK